ncbi:MAG TPA: OmpH family outer membrane protein [Terriglobales bacterium]
MTRNFARYFTIAALATFVAAFAVTGFAQTTTPTNKIGVVDIQAAIFSCNEGQRDFQALQKQFEPKKTEIDGLGKEVDELKKQYSAQGDKLNAEARDNLVKQIDTKQKQLNRVLEDAQGDAQQKQQEIVNRIGQKMLAVLDKYAKQNSFSLVLDVSGQQNPVLWAAETVNITPAIVQAYNTESGVPAPPKPAGAATGAPARPAGATGTAAPTTRPATTTPPKPKP